MRFRKLRIAWSVFWGLACVLLIVLWVRSYFHGDDITWVLPDGECIRCDARRGELLVCRYPAIKLEGDNRRTFSHQVNINPNVRPRDWPSTYYGFAFAANYLKDGIYVAILPQWITVAMFAVLAAVPWIRLFSWRFSLRTLLIATTLVAVALGIIAYAIR
jgi:hypothetical protein